MESAQDKELNPFGRQPQPVKVTISGAELVDVDYWCRELARRAEFKGDMITGSIGRREGDLYITAFTIYPRAVND